MSILTLVARDLIESLDPVEYIRRFDELEPYEWQIFILNRIRAGDKRISIVGARQSGKSTIIAGVPAYVCKNEKALSLIYAPSKEQAEDDIMKVKEYINNDDSYPNLQLDSLEHVKLPNGSFIKANAATAKTKRGKSKPRILLFDEAALIEDPLYKTVRPMLTNNPNCILLLLSSPFGKRGFFYKTQSARGWLKVMVKAPWDIVDGKLVEAEPEKKFRARMLEKGIYGFYSPRHTDYAFMQEELGEQGERWFRQEYLCEFVETEDSAFAVEYIEAAARDYTPLFGGSGEESDYEPLKIG